MFLQGILIFAAILTTTIHGYTYYTQVPQMRGIWPRNRAARPDLVSGVYADDTPLVTVPWISDLAYNQADRKAFQDAAEVITAATKKCIRFQRRFSEDVITPTETKGFIRLSQRELPTVEFPEGRPRGVCLTVPGYSIQGGENGQGQVMVAFRGKDPKQGCLQNPRDTVRLLMNVLGIGNEFERSDRQTTLSFATNYRDLIADSLKPEDTIQQIVGVKSTLTILPDQELDVNSITMVSPDRFAQSQDAPIFRVLKGRVPTDVKLSKGDCEGLNNLYGCDITCDSSDDEGFITAPVGSFDSVDLNLNCWGRTDAGQPIALADRKDLVTLRLVNDTAPPLLTYTIQGPGATFVTVATTAPSADVVLQLTQKVDREQDLAFTVVGRGADGQIWVEGEVSLHINCLPRLAVDGKQPKCTEPFLGTSEIQCTVEDPVPVRLSRCVGDKGLPRHFSFDPVQATDPDESNSPVFVSLYVEEVQVTGPDVIRTPVTGWIRHPFTGKLVYTGSQALGPNVDLEFTFTCLDARRNGVTKLKQQFNFRCIENYPIIGRTFGKI